MISISVQADIRRATAALSDIARKQIPFASAQAITALAFEIQRAEKANILDTFAHPRPFTANSAAVSKASKANPTALVSIRPETARYLAPYEFGGAHILPGKGRTLLNPKRVGLDRYGQLTKNRLNSLASRPDVFIGRVKAVTGFWQRTRRHGLRLLIRFGDALPTTKRLGFTSTAETIVKSRFAVVFNQALAKAIASAKR